MEIYGKKVNLKSVSLFLLHFLIFADIIFISVGLLLDLPDDISFYIILFDLMICIFLLSEWIIRFHRAKSKKEFLKEKENWVTLIASIPFEALFPAIIPGANLLRYIMLFKLLRIMVLYNKFFNGFKKFIKKTNLDKIIGAIIFTVVIFTFLYLFFGSSNSLFESFYFVVVTLTTVGYGDIVPKTFNERIITLLLIIVGIFVVSTITAALSSYLTDRLMEKEEGNIVGNLRLSVEENSQNIMDELKIIRQENKRLQDEIDELKKKMDND
ncbi:ion channel [Methanobrevibacter sp.]|uniref:ion channel n=1 Tax=Methanobrevibacter sp. TaxID=66852 RepID=UPI00386EDE59